jgi:tetratricopeptide (TPR) repeat protein
MSVGGSRLAAAVVVVLGIAAGKTARAGTSQEEQARQHFVVGQEEYERGHYGEALRQFELGYALSPRPEFLLNFAQAHRKLGDYDRAIVECERFLATAPGAALASSAERLLGQLREEQAALRTRAPVESPPPPPPAKLAEPRPTPDPLPTQAIAAPPPKPHRRWVGAVIGVSVAIVAAGAIALGVGLAYSQGHSYPASPIGTVDFR